MKFDMMLLEFFIGSFVCCFGMFISGLIILKRNIKTIKFYKYFYLIILSILLIINSMIFDNLLKIFGAIGIGFCIYKFILNENKIDSLILGIISYILCLISEIIYVLIVTLFDFIFYKGFFPIIIRSISINFIIVIISCLLSLILKKVIRYFIKVINKKSIVFLCTLGAITSFTILSSIFNLITNNFVFDYNFVLNCVIVFGCTILTVFSIREYLKNNETIEKYKVLEEYLKTSAELIEKYSSNIHSYKNNLIAIKGYMKKDVNEAIEYVDNLLDKYKTKKYRWIKHINRIKFDSIRYLIYYKLSQAENKNLKILVDVSQELKKVDFKKNNIRDTSIILDLLGEYFDNAIYAANESKEKELILNCYLNENKVIFEISNTYANDIDIDQLTKNGYTTKGEGHGFGLYEASKIIRSNKFLFSEVNLVDEYFITRFTINLKK